DFAGGVVHSSSDHVDLGRGARALFFQGHGKSASPRSRDRGITGADHDFGNVIARDLHFHGADFDFKMIVVDAPHDSRWTSYRFELDGVSLGNVFDHLRAGPGIVFIRTGGVRDYGGIKLFAEFAAYF